MTVVCYSRGMDKKQSTLGILVIAAGVAVLLANINIGPMRDVLAHWWPMFIIVLGLFMWWSNPRNFAWPLVVTILGVIFLANSLSIAQVNFGDIVIPALLIGFGVSMFVNAARKPLVRVANGQENITAVLSGTANRNKSADYTGGRVSAFMGGAEIDISKAVIKKEAVLDLAVFMGGIELRVADDVVVKNRSTVFMGGIEDKTKPSESKSNPVLYLTGSIFMGGVEVKR